MKEKKAKQRLLHHRRMVHDDHGDGGDTGVQLQDGGGDIHNGQNLDKVPFREEHMLAMDADNVQGVDIAMTQVELGDNAAEMFASVPDDREVFGDEQCA